MCYVEYYYRAFPDRRLKMEKLIGQKLLFLLYKGYILVCSFFDECTYYLQAVCRAESFILSSLFEWYLSWNQILLAFSLVLKMYYSITTTAIESLKTSYLFTSIPNINITLIKIVSISCISFQITCSNICLL